MNIMKLSLLLSSAMLLTVTSAVVAGQNSGNPSASDTSRLEKREMEKNDANNKKKDKNKTDEVVNTDKATEVVNANEGTYTSPTKAIPPTLKINGFTLFNTYVVNQSNRTNGKGGAPLHFATDVSDLYFTVAGRAQAVDYSYRVNIQTYPGSSPTIDKNYIEIKTENYAVRMGSTVGPEDFAIYDGGKVIGGAGGFDSASYANVFNLSAGVIKNNDNIMDTGNAAKIVVMGPEYRGFQFFAAYTPNTAKGGDAGKDNHFPDNGSIPGNGGKGIYPQKSMQPYGMNNWSFAVNYKYAYEAFNMTLSGAAVTESSYYTVSGQNNSSFVRAKLRDNLAYQLGAVFGYKDVQWGLGYLDSRSARLPKAANMQLNSAGTLNSGNMHLGNSGKAWNTAFSYTLGAYKFSAGYQNFARKTEATQRATNDVFTLAVNFNVFQGLQVYAEATHINSKTNKNMVDFVTAASRAQGGNFTPGVGNNTGQVGIVGMKVGF